ncbi:nitroreductase family protein [Terrisporobacter sp.]|uniref:nitroreductase family protein n=1 Tax=Terrisporobacter sp. TaxID=1965305 RepID=UPI00262F2707|nr:nitroreductase family protein [Terrisporobacter sp.]
MELYDAIFYRKTIKSYSDKKIKQPLLEEIKKLCCNITYLNNDLNIKAHLIERGHLIHFSIGKEYEVKAPHYILMTSNKGEDYLQNVGFAMEELILELTCLGVGSTWLQCKLKREDVEEFMQLDEIDMEEEDYEDKIEYPVSLIAIGYPDKYDSLFRKGKKSYNRKKMKDICKTFNPKWNEVFEGVRVSPSIMNQQPWLFKENDYGFDLYECLPKKKYKIEEESKISMGGALRHFDICCKENNLNVEYAKKTVNNKRMKEYFISIIDKNQEEI